MTKTDIEFIKTIGSQWQFLLVVFLITIFIIKWKTIWSAVSTFTQIRVKRGDNEFEIHREKENVPINHQNGQKKVKPKEDDLEDENKDGDTINDDKDFNSLEIQYFDYLIDRNHTEAEKVLNKILEQQETPEKRNDIKIRSLYQRHLYGDTKALNELEDYIKNQDNKNNKANALFYAGLIYKEANNPERAIELFKKSIRITSEEEHKVFCIRELSNIYFENDSKNEAIEILLDNQKEIKNSQNLSKLYLYIAKYYEKQDEKLLQAVAFQKALELVPNDSSLLFDSAYNFSDTKENKDVGLYLYKKLLNYQPKDENTLNNTGVAYANLNLKFQSINYYKKAINQNSSLASANLVHELIKVGLDDEAKDYISKAEKFDEVHDNLIRAKSDLFEKIRDEKELEKSLMDTANKKYKFYKYFGNAAFDNSGTLNHFPSELKIDNHKVRVTFLNNKKVVKINWEVAEEKHSISGTITNRAIQANYKKPKKNIYNFGDHDRYSYDDYAGIGYILEKANEMKFFFQREKEIVTLKFV